MGHTNISLQTNLKNASCYPYDSVCMHTACMHTCSVSTILSKEQRPSKCKAQLFDCGVTVKIQVLQIPETCTEDSNKGGTNPLVLVTPEPQQTEESFWCELLCFSIRVPWILWCVFTLEVPANSSDREKRTCNPGNMQLSQEGRDCNITRSNCP